MGTKIEATNRRVRVATSAGEVDGVLQLPARPRALVIFAHGAGSTHLSRRNAAVAETLEAHDFGSLRFDLLTEAEAADRANVFDTALLGARLVEATRWARRQPELAGLPLAYFGASTGAAAALLAAAALPDEVSAVVSRGGRPDLALEDLPRVKAPTMLIVGGRDEPVVSLNRSALRALACPKRLVVVPGATHLFEEAGAMNRVSDLAVEWLERHTPQPGEMAEFSSSLHGSLAPSGRE